MKFAAAVRADGQRLDRVAATGVHRHPRRLLDLVAVATLHQRQHHRQQVAALIGEPVLEAAAVPIAILASRSPAELLDRLRDGWAFVAGTGFAAALISLAIGPATGSGPSPKPGSGLTPASATTT